MGPPFHLHVFVVKRLSGAASCTKFLTCPGNKLHNPKKTLTWVMSLGGAAAANALSLSAPGLMPSEVNLNPE